MAKRQIANKPADPSLPTTPITIKGKTYQMCFDYGALAEAEAYFNGLGHNVSLLAALPVMNLSNIRVVFVCATHKFHPELSFDDASKLVTIANAYAIAAAIGTAWEEAAPESDKSESSEGNEQAA